MQLLSQSHLAANPVFSILEMLADWFHTYSYSHEAEIGLIIKLWKQSFCGRQSFSL